MECKKIPKEACELLAECLRKNKTISDIFICLSSPNAKDCSVIFEGLKYSVILKKISLSCGIYTADTIKNIRETIMNNNSLKTLYLYLELKNDLIDDFFDVISCGKALEEITISGINYPKTEYKTLEKMLLSCKKLRKFTLCFGKVDANVCKSISNSLENGCSAEYLGIIDCQMGFKCAREIFKGLAKNKKVKILNFAQNRINNDCTRTIIDTLKINATITQINLQGNRFNNTSQENIINVSISSNPNRKIIF